MTAAVAIIMGSQSDWDTMRHAAETLDTLGVACDKHIVSAHRTPDRLFAFAKGAKAAGFRIIIAGAGGAAHLPGMTASLTDSVCALRQATSRPDSAESFSASTLAASSAALMAPGLPIASVPTGIPAGICTIE